MSLHIQTRSSRFHNEKNKEKFIDSLCLSWSDRGLIYKFKTNIVEKTEIISNLLMAFQHVYLSIKFLTSQSTQCCAMSQTKCHCSRSNYIHAHVYVIAELPFRCKHVIWQSDDKTNCLSLLKIVNSSTDWWIPMLNLIILFCRVDVSIFLHLDHYPYGLCTLFKRWGHLSWSFSMDGIDLHTF